MTIPCQEGITKPCSSKLTMPAVYLTKFREEDEKQETNFKFLISEQMKILNEMRQSGLDTYRLADKAVSSESYRLYIDGQGHRNLHKLSFQKFETSHIVTEITGKVGEVIYVRFKLKEIGDRYKSTKVHIFKNKTAWKSFSTKAEFGYNNYSRTESVHYYWYYEGFITINNDEKITFRSENCPSLGNIREIDIDKEASYLCIQRLPSQ